MKEALGSFAMPAYEQIPDVGLYLEQVARFINSFLTAYPEMTVTPSMISNYAKQKLIARIMAIFLSVLMLGSGLTMIITMIIDLLVH
jgi:hypothetical protein